MDNSGSIDPMNTEDATYWYHIFTSAVYFTPIIGAIVADIFFGKYRTILFLSIVYCLGHIALALDETRLGLSIGLTLIAIGAGGIKPCFCSCRRSIWQTNFTYWKKYLAGFIFQ